MSTEFKAVAPQRAVQIMRAWALHSWPMSVQDGIEVYTGLGFSGDSGSPEMFTSDVSPDEPDSYFASLDGLITSLEIAVTNVLPKEAEKEHLSRARGFYCSCLRAFEEQLGAPIREQESRARRNAQWFLTNGTGVRLSGTNRMVTLFLESPEMADIHQDDLRRGIADYSPANDPLLEG